jgi:aryl-alcohol dehydrogenase-like predicted oxidoreductase
MIRIGGETPVRRLGFGAMQLTGPDFWGPPVDRVQAVAVARRAVELGVNFVDTADAYGPGSNEEILAEALHPYPDDLVIATKAGLCRPGPTEWEPLGRPEYLRQQAELSLRRLRLDRIDLFQLHRIDPRVPLADQLGALDRLKDEGKIRHIGLSEVDVEQIRQAREVAEVASVQNLYNVAARDGEAVLDYCEQEHLVFIPYFPMARGQHARPKGPLADVAEQLDATPAQVALAWLLQRSPVTLPIPGTKSVGHLEENMGAANVRLSDDQFEHLSRAPDRVGDRR